METNQLNEYRKIREIENESRDYTEVPIVSESQKLLEHLDPDVACEYIEHLLRNEYFDITTGRWKQYKEAYSHINERGITEIMVRIRSVINRNTVYGNLSEEIISKITIDFAKELAIFLALNYKKFGMRVVDIRKVVNICANMVYITLMRGENAVTLRLLRTMIQSKELLTGETAKEKEKEKKGLFSFIK